MKTSKLLLPLVFVCLSFSKTDDRIRLIFEEQKTMRSSFCLYSDGKFYETRAAGCVEQLFSSGSWENTNDTITLTYQANNLFDFEILKSRDTASKYQIIRILDCYNQPVRFQHIYADITSHNLYNTGMLQIEKGKSLFYLGPVFGQKAEGSELIICSADTVTYKWHCNRESLESINGGRLFVNTEAMTKKVTLRNKRVIAVQ